MSTLTSADFPLGMDPIDHVAIREYLNVDGAAYVAGLAGTIAQRAAMIDANVLVKQALRIHREAVHQFNNYRTETLYRMNQRTLLHLAHQLNIEQPEVENDKTRPFLADPVAGPVLLRIWKPSDFPLGSDYQTEQTKEYIRAELVRYPDRPATGAQFPWTTAETLRIVTGDYNVHERVLKSAFLDFLTKHSMFDADLRLLQLQDLVNRSELNLQDPLLSAEEREFHTRRKNDASDAIQSIRTSKTNQEPISQHPRQSPEIKERAEEIFRSYESGNGRASLSGILNILRSDFQGFWESHKKDYVEKTYIPTPPSFEAALRGVQSRERKRYLIILEKFLETVEPQTRADARAHLAEKLQNYTLNNPKHKHFLGTLCNAVDRTNPVPEVMGLLRDYQFTIFKNMDPSQKRKKSAKLDSEGVKALKEHRCPPQWVDFKSLTESAVQEYLERIKLAVRFG